MKQLMPFLFFAISPLLTAQPTIRQYLSGTGSDHTVNWDFYCTGGSNSGVWSTIPVPSNWEQQGFGSYNYGLDKHKADEKGLYRTSFELQEYYKKQVVYIVFEGSMTDTRVKINGLQAGPVHQGAFNRFRYDITPWVKPGKSNLLEVEVSKMSANRSVNDAERSGDYWVFGGIYRPVYLEILPFQHIHHVAIDAKGDGSIQIDLQYHNLKKECYLQAEVFSAGGKPLGNPILSGPALSAEAVSLTGKIDSIEPWSAEFPNLYHLKLSVRNKQHVIHQTETRFGFRTIEARKGEGIFLNGKRVILKGVNRHSTNSISGKTLSKAISIKDVNLMKEMNMNAVRMSHYSPDDHFLDACDSLGVYVLDELAGWQKCYDDTVGPLLVKELVEDDVNHPCILFWDNGNEGGWNRNLDDDFALYDPQKRTIIHPWENIYGINTKHYPDFNMLQNTVMYSDDIYMPTEFMHGLYDGGHGAGLEDFWKLMLQHRCLGGGFLWVFQDEGISRRDKNGQIDTDRNHAPDGILGPGYEKEASFYTIKEIWSPIYIERKTIPPGFNGKLRFENRYSFTHASQCHFSWQLKSFSGAALPDPQTTAVTSGTVVPPDVPPGESGWLVLNLPADWQRHGALYLTAQDPSGRELFTWSWPLKQPVPENIFPSSFPEDIPFLVETDSLITIYSGQTKYLFDKHTGYLMRAETQGRFIPLGHGPRLAGSDALLTRMEFSTLPNGAVIQTEFRTQDGKDWLIANWTFEMGMPAKLDYKFWYSGDMPYMGITFDLPEKEIQQVDFLGRGPYRVWKNRLRGTLYDLWEKLPNQTVTGESYDYPEFPGYYSGVQQVVFHTLSGSITVTSENSDFFLQLYRAYNPSGAYNNNTSVDFPEGDIGFLKAIPPIGTKFQPAYLMGPQSQLNAMYTTTPFTGSLLLIFE